MTRTTSKDLIDFLVIQHQQIRSLLEEVLAAEGHERHNRFRELRELLAVHEAAEAEIAHPIAQRSIGPANFCVDLRLYEEDEARRVLGDLERLDLSSREFEIQFIGLQNAVSRHMEAEEKWEFQYLRGELSQEHRERLTRAIELAAELSVTRRRDRQPQMAMASFDSFMADVRAEIAH